MQDNLFELVNILIIVLIYLYYVGFGITKTLLPSSLKNNEILITPFVGFAVTISIAHYISYTGGSSKIFIFFILLISTIFNILSIIRNERLQVNLSENGIPFIVACLVFFTAIFPLFYQDSITTVGWNGDAVVHNIVSDFLINNGADYNPKAEWNIPSTIIRFANINSGYSLGFHYFQSTIATVTSTKTYMNFSILTALFLAAIPIAVYIFCRSLNFTYTVSCLIMLLIAFNNILFWSYADDFATQLAAISLVPLALAFFFLTFRESSNKSIFMCSLFFSTILSTYTIALLYVILPIVFYLIISNYVLGRKESNILLFLKIIFFSIFINLPGIIRFIDFFFTIVKVFLHPFPGLEGNIQGLIPLHTFYGLTPYKNPFISDYGFYSLLFNNVEGKIIVFIALFIIIVLSVYSTVNLIKSRRYEILSVIISYFLIDTLIRYSGFAYGYYKALTFSLFIFIIVLVMGVQNFYTWGVNKKVSNWVKLFCILFIGLLMASNIYSTYLTASGLTRIGISADKDFIETSNAVHVLVEDHNATILFIDDNVFKQFWVAYFLKDYKLIANDLYALPDPNIVFWKNGAIPENIDSYKDLLSIDYILKKDRTISSSPPSCFRKIWDGSGYTLFRNLNCSSVIAHYPAENISSGYFLILNSNSTLAINIYEKLFTVNNSSFPFKEEGVKDKNISIGVKIYSFNSSSTQFRADGKILNYSISEYDNNLYIISLSKMPSQLEINNSEDFLIIDWFEVYNSNASKFKEPSQYPILINSKTNIDVEGRKLVSDIKLNSPNEPLTITLNIYDLKNGSNNMLYGWWGITAPKNTKTEQIKFVSDLSNQQKRGFYVYLNNIYVGSMQESGPAASEGDFIVDLAVRDSSGIIYLKPILYYTVEENNITKVKIQDINEIMK